MKKTAQIFLLLSFILLMTGCVKAEKEPIRIGVNSWPPCEVWYVAQEQGFFEDVPVEIVRFSSWTDNMSSLYLGNVDITHSTYFNSVYFSDKGKDAVLLAPIDYIEGGDGLVIKKSIGTIENLKGKTIGVEVGTDEHFLLHKALQSAGLNLSDVQIVSLPSYLSHENFIAGELDALFTYEPFLSQAANGGDGEIVFTTRELPGYMVDVLLGEKEKFDSNRESYEIVQAAWYKALEYIKENPAEAFEMMGKNEEMSAVDFEIFYNGFTFFDQAQAREVLDSDEIKSRLEEMHKFTEETGLTKGQMDTETLIEKLLTPKGE